MSQGPAIDGVIEHVGNQPAETVAPVARDAPAPASEQLDPDLRELEEAKAAAAAETTTEQAPPDPKPAQQPAKEPSAQPMIPKPRFDQVLQERDELSRRAAYLAGQIDALKTAPRGQASDTPAPAAITVESRLAEVQTGQDALAQKFDNGEITYSQLLQQQRALSAVEDQIREEKILARVPRNAPAPAASTGAYLEDQTASLQGEHPWIEAFADPEDFELLHARAKRELVAEGHRIEPTEASILQVRRRICELSDTIGPALFPAYQIPGQQPAVAPQQPARSTALSPQAAARAQKLAMQGDMPPDLTNAPSAGGGSALAGITTAQIEAMSDDDIAALPAATRKAFLGVT